MTVMKDSQMFELPVTMMPSGGISLFWGEGIVLEEDTSVGSLHQDTFQNYLCLERIKYAA